MMQTVFFQGWVQTKTDPRARQDGVVCTCRTIPFYIVPIMPIFLIAILLFIIFGMTPTVTIRPLPDQPSCSHITVTRFFGTVTLVDTIGCEGDSIDVNGQVYKVE